MQSLLQTYWIGECQVQVENGTNMYITITNNPDKFKTHRCVCVFYQGSTCSPNFCNRFNKLNDLHLVLTFHGKFKKHIINVENSESVRLLASEFSNFYNEISYHFVYIVWVNGNIAWTHYQLTQNTPHLQPLISFPERKKDPQWSN